MSIKATLMMCDVANAPTSTRYNIFLELFNHLPVERMAQRLVNRFASHEIERFVEALQKELRKGAKNNGAQA